MCFILLRTTDFCCCLFICCCWCMQNEESRRDVKRRKHVAGLGRNGLRNAATIVLLGHPMLKRLLGNDQVSCIRTAYSWMFDILRVTLCINWCHFSFRRHVSVTWFGYKFYALLALEAKSCICPICWCVCLSVQVCCLNFWNSIFNEISHFGWRWH